MRLVVMGDTHIPDRADSIPEKIVEFVRDVSPDLIIFTGDLTDASVLKFLKSISEVVAVRGNMDFLRLPDFAEIEIYGVRAGVIHGHQVYPRGDVQQLKDVAVERGVRVLFNGHTHSPQIRSKSGIVLLNPGSVTGVWGGGKASLIPSFLTVECKKGEIGVNLHELRRIEGKDRIVMTETSVFRF